MGPSNAEFQSAADAADEQAVPSIQRLTASDLMLIWPEEKGWPQDIGALAILDGRSCSTPMAASGSRPPESTSGDGCTSFPASIRSCTGPDSGLGWPLWVDAPSVDIAEHVGVFPVAAPG